MGLTTIPNYFTIKQNYPDPFNQNIRIQYSLHKDIYVNINIFDLSGKLVKLLVNSFERAGVKKNYVGMKSRFWANSFRRNVYYSI